MSLATGGTITTSGLYTIHTFLLADDDTDFTVLSGSLPCELLAVGGGGGGGFSGGGGGGDVVLATLLLTGANRVRVGAGGTKTGVLAGASSVAGVVAIGGGFGEGRDGGCGGGGSYAVDWRTGGRSLARKYAGGDGSSGSAPYAGGGGGGAGAAGQNAPDTSTGGNGGDGVQSSFDGTSRYYGGGGGGGSQSAFGTGGLGGGGNGSGNQELPGTAGLGGGGGGGGWSGRGGAGGSGRVMIRYLTVQPSTGVAMSIGGRFSRRA